MAVQFTFDAIGTSWVIDIQDSASIATPQLQNIVQQEIVDRIELFDKTYSRFRPDSLVTKMSQQRGIYTVPDDAQMLFALYKKLYELTYGRMTPLIGGTLEQAGYDAQYSLKPETLSTPLSWEEAIVFSYPNIEMLQPVLLDVGAAGKGYLVDIIAELLQKKGITSFCIDAGGDIVHHSADAAPLEIALEDPFDTTHAIGIARINNQSLCGSAGNRRKWGEFTHIIDPVTLSSKTHIAATWVVAKTGLLADGLATALYFAAPEQLVSEFSFEYLILYIDGSVQQSTAFPAELFYQ